MSNDEQYRATAARMIEWGRKRAEVESADRDQMVWDSHRAGHDKTAISRFTGLHWATVDRIVRKMAEEHGEEAGDD